MQRSLAPMFGAAFFDLADTTSLSQSDLPKESRPYPVADNSNNQRQIENSIPKAHHKKHIGGRTR